MKKVIYTLWAAGVAVALVAPVPAWSDDAKPKVRFGGDERIREEAFDDIPIKSDPPGVTRGGDNNYFRFRTRLWGEADPFDMVTLRARVVNEFRIWDNPDQDGKPQSSSYLYPEEWVFDNLYLDVRDLWPDTLDLRIGRQDLVYGTGKLLLEGTPKDGSRTIYFNAIKATFKGLDKNTLDLFGIYNDPEDQLAINSADRDLTGYFSGNNNMRESGGGLYLKNTAVEKLPFEAYYIFKREGDWTQTVSTNKVAIDALDLHTVGFRLMPKFSDELTGNLELAGQAGERGDQDVRGYGLDSLLTYAPANLKSVKMAMDGGLYYLSGNDPDSDEDEGWNPLWARYPQNSDLYVYCYDADGAGRWSNLIMPHLGASLYPFEMLKTSAMLAYLYAVENDGPGGGDERGLLASLKGEFTLGQSVFMKDDKLSGHLQLEILEPGHYYKVDDTAYFARWELNYAF